MILAELFECEFGLVVFVDKFEFTHYCNDLSKVEWAYLL
jgi:hypothetical protein